MKMKNRCFHWEQRFFCLDSATAAAALVAVSVAAQAEEDDQRDDDDPNRAIVKQIAKTVHSILHSDALAPDFLCDFRTL